MSESSNALRTVTPYFTVADADTFIAFVISVFEAELFKEDRYENSRIQHARLRFGDSIIMLNEANETYPATQSQMHVYVDDVDARYAKALEHGAGSLMTPNQRPHGDRMAGVHDAFGNIWWLAEEI